MDESHLSANQHYINHVIVLTIACEYAIQVLTIAESLTTICEYNYLYYYSPDSLYTLTYYARLFCSTDVIHDC